VNRRGEFTFITDWHDDGEKTVLGQTIPSGGGQSDGDRVLDILIDHPSTPHFVCTRLVRRFVADDPPATMVDACVTTWRETGGDIRAVVRTLLNHPEFDTAPLRLKRPFELLVSLLRATGARYDGNDDLIYRLDRLGHRPFAWPTPDGYPDTAVEWSGNVLGRWNLALDAFAGDLPGVEIDVNALAHAGHTGQDTIDWLQFFARLFLSRDLDVSEYNTLLEFVSGDTDRLQLLGLLAATPSPVTA
jgi:uncharacterized protein (DUF1800 family)